MKRLGILLDGMLVYRRVTPSIKFTHLYTWVERGTVKIECLAQEHNTVSLARAWTQTARSGDECTNHEATLPPQASREMLWCLERKPHQLQLAGFHVVPSSWWISNLEMLVLQEGGKPEYLEKTEYYGENQPQTQPTYQTLVSNHGHIGGSQVFSVLHHPCCLIKLPA